MPPRLNDQARHAAIRRLNILSIDHGAHDLVPVAEALGADPARIPAFKLLAVEAAARVAAGRPGFGMFLDGDLGRAALSRAGELGFWLARQFPHGAPEASARPLMGWPSGQIVKLIANGRADALMPLEKRLDDIRRVLPVAAKTRRETLIEALPAENGTTTAFLARLYAEGLKPDYWLIECQKDDANWREIDTVIGRYDPACRGAIVIARSAESGPELAVAGSKPRVIGFVGGRAIFGEPMKKWLAGSLDDDSVVTAVAERFARLASAFNSAAAETNNQ